MIRIRQGSRNGNTCRPFPFVPLKIPQGRSKKDRCAERKLFHMDRFRRADIHAGLAVHAHILVNLGFFVFHGYCRCRAFTHAGFASGTFCRINNCYQRVHSIVIMRSEIKNRFRFRQGDGRSGFLEAKDIVHAIDARFFACHPAGSPQGPACKD